jgi:hypothetical protein
MSFELVLMEPPGSTGHDAPKLAKELMKLSELGHCKVLPLSDLDEEGAVEMLREAFEDEEVDKNAYVAFCRERGLPDDVGEPDPKAALAFYRETEGVDLVTIDLPRSGLAVGAYAALVGFAKREGLLLHNPQGGKHVSLDDPGKLPEGF